MIIRNGDTYLGLSIGTSFNSLNSNHYCINTLAHREAKEVLEVLCTWMNEIPSDALITRLLEDGDELQANMGFYFAVWNITRDIRDYELPRRNLNSSGTKNKRQINKSIINHLETFYSFYNCCSIERKAALLMNYILSENEYPIQFGYWLMEEELQEALIYEITSSKKINKLDKLLKIVRLIHHFPCKDVNGACQKKDRLYAAVLIVLKSFISEKKGVYLWDNSQEILFQDVCKILPRRYLKQLYVFLKKTSTNLMVSKLDEMVRFSIYLEEKKQWDICQGMMKVIDATDELKRMD